MAGAEETVRVDDAAIKSAEHVVRADEAAVENARLQSSPTRSGVSGPGNDAIISKGLKAGEKVVTDGQPRLVQGSTVEVRQPPARGR